MRHAKDPAQETTEDHPSVGIWKTRQYYEQRLTHHASDAEAMHGLSMLAADQQQWDVAMLWIQKALILQPNSAPFHHHLAQLLRYSKQDEAACTHYRSALRCDPSYAEAHNNFGILLFKQKKYTEAHAHYVQAVALRPNYIEAHFNLGLLLLTQTKSEAAIKQFKQVLALDPHSTQTHWQLANLYWQRNDWNQVRTHYQALQELTPLSPELLNNLGALALKQNQLEHAIAYFKQALSHSPHHKASRINLAASLLHHHELSESICHYSLYLSLEPDDQEALYNRAQGLMLTGQLQAALKDLTKLLTLAPNHHDAGCNLAAIHLRLGNPSTAKQIYQGIVQNVPGHSIATYMLSALTQQSVPSAPPLDYIKNLFDNYAPHFDQHLQKTLNYQTPTRLYELLASDLPNKKIDILDLGCGTGLSSLPFSKIAATLTGIDISAEMLTRASAKNCYQILVENDILSALSQLQQYYDVILSIDTLVYFGDLGVLFQKVASRLKKGGLFAFSIELASEAITSYQLQTTGRYQHAMPHIEHIASQNHWKLLRKNIITGRFQDQIAVQTGLFVFQKADTLAHNPR